MKTNKHLPILLLLAASSAAIAGELERHPRKRDLLGELIGTSSGSTAGGAAGTTSSSSSESTSSVGGAQPTTTTSSQTSSSTGAPLPTTSSSTTTSAPTTAPTSSSSSTKSSSSSSTTSQKQTIITITSTIINSDGTTSTATSLEASNIPNSTSHSNTGKTWGIVGGVVGGVVLLVGILLVVWRFTQRRFSDLDHDGADEIKWPELQADGLNPPGTRRTGGSGIEMSSRGGDEDDEWDARDDGHSTAGWNYGSGGLGSASTENFGSYSGQGAGGYYDPYLGRSAAPTPAPPNLPPSAMSPPPRSFSPYYVNPSTTGSLDDMILDGRKN